MNISYKIIEREFGEDWDIFEELISDYEEALPGFLESIKSAIDENDFQNLMIHAHTLKGIVANFYCDELTKAAFELEKCGREENEENLNNKFDQLSHLSKQITANLRTYSSSRS